jgi:hypothetical protein
MHLDHNAQAVAVARPRTAATCSGTLASLRRELGQPGYLSAPGPARTQIGARALPSNGKAGRQLAGYEMRTITQAPPSMANPPRPAWSAFAFLAALLIAAGMLRDPRDKARATQRGRR